MRLGSSLLLSSALLLSTATTAFVSHRPLGVRKSPLFAEPTTANPLGLTPELLKLTNAFDAIGDDKLRYKQLLYMASQLQPLDDKYKIDANVVPGCLSTVHVHASLKDGLVFYEGDSDGLLTKGLVALLIRGLNGNKPEDIQLVDPQFIQKAGISQSLTPGRNNGFLNMLAVMKKKALELQGASESSSEEEAADGSSVSSSSSSGKPMYNAILKSLEKLQPTKVELTDVSYKHEGHAGAKGLNGESHFELYIVADAFDGLNLVKRHKLVYMMLGDVMQKIHALQIKAQTPQEADS